MKPTVEELQATFIPLWHAEVRRLLPALPAKLAVDFDNRYLIPLTGTGGFAAARDRVILSYDPAHPSSEEEQLHELRASYFHECYHTIQGWVGYVQYSPLEEAIFEGAATVFERERAGVNPPWGQYPERATVLGWLDQVKELPPDYDRQRWKFVDPASGAKWIIYRLGTFIVDEALAQKPELTIENLVAVPPLDILGLARLN